MKTRPTNWKLIKSTKLDRSRLKPIQTRQFLLGLLDRDSEILTQKCPISKKNHPIKEANV